VDAEVFRALAVEIQGPQHLAPWLWRTDQWAAAAAYLVLAWFGIADAVRMRHECTEVAWRRIVALFVCGVILLACGWFGVAVMRDLRLTLFQPFRLATVLRGVALLLVAPSFARLWTTRGPWERLRVAALACGLGFDQALLVVVAAELAARAWLHASVRWARVVWLIVILCGLVHLSAHDPQGSGGVLAAVLAVVGAGERVIRRAGILWNARRRALVIASSWAVPALALCGGLAAIGAGETPEWARSAVERCRFFETPFDDMERLGAWARRNLPEDAVLVGPPESKTLRLWSRRAVSFNRAGSPYHGRALLVWGERFRRHVAFAGDTRELARAYQRDRARLEARYYELSCEELSILLDEMNASHVVTHSQREDELARGGIERLHVEGRYAIYVRRARVLASR
jgi:hypothetical protein